MCRRFDSAPHHKGRDVVPALFVPVHVFGGQDDPDQVLKYRLRRGVLIPPHTIRLRQGFGERCSAKDTASNIASDKIIAGQLPPSSEKADRSAITKNHTFTMLK